MQFYSVCLLTMGIVMPETCWVNLKVNKHLYLCHPLVLPSPTLWRTLNVTCFLLPAVPFLPILGSFEANIIAQLAQKNLDNTGYGHRISTHTGCKTSGVRTLFLNCQSITISGVSGARLNKFYCIWKNTVHFTCVLRAHRTITNTRNSSNNFKNLNIFTNHEL